MKSALLLLAVFAVWKTCEACSCMKSHPQSQFCRSDFAMVATVRRHMHTSDPMEIAYKLKIRRKFKMSIKAERALKAGRLVTPRDDSMCGVQLKLNETYVITGLVSNLEARVNLCNYFEVWRVVTPRQRKGFRLLYKQGCHCNIQPCYGGKCKQKKNTCYWENPFSALECQEKHGICLINQKGQCAWARASRLTECHIKEGRKIPKDRKY